MPFDGEPLEFARLVGPDSRLPPGDVDLLCDGVDSRKVGEQQTSPPATLYDHAVPSWVKIRLDARLRFGEHIHRKLELVELVICELVIVPELKLVIAELKLAIV